MRGSQYTKEFKDSTVQLALNSEKSVLKIGADLDVNPKTIYNWIREYKVENNIKGFIFFHLKIIPNIPM